VPTLKKKQLEIAFPSIGLRWTHDPNGVVNRNRLRWTFSKCFLNSCWKWLGNQQLGVLRCFPNPIPDGNSTKSKRNSRFGQFSKFSSNQSVGRFLGALVAKTHSSSWSFFVIATATSGCRDYWIGPDDHCSCQDSIESRANGFTLSFPMILCNTEVLASSSAQAMGTGFVNWSWLFGHFPQC